NKFKKKKMTLKRILIIIIVGITFIIPLVQLSIGFTYLNKPVTQCPIARDIPLVLAFGGMFTLLFLATAYGLLYTISDRTNSSGKTIKIIMGNLKCF
ncbi:unnamed protein product, partial [Didymodactylos carnosus]